MTVNATWEIAVDLTKDGDFSDANEDITAFVKSMDWSLGFSRQFDTLSRVVELTLILDNKTNIFSPEHASALTGWTRGRVIRIRSIFESTTRVMFIGWIRPIEPTPGERRAQECRVVCEGFLARAMKTPVKVPVQISKTADEVLDAILGNSLIFPPGFTGRWLLGEVGFGELGDNTILGAVSDFLISDTGITTFSYVGDQWQQGATVYAAIDDTVGRENGRLYLNRDGVIVFWNRHHLIIDTTSDATVNDSMVEMDYVYGDDIVNRAVVNARPRRVSNTPVTVAKVDQPQRIPAKQGAVNGSAEVLFRYQQADDSGVRVGGIDAITPQAFSDFVANDTSDGSGTDRTGLVSAVLDEQFATQAKVTFSNSHTTDVHLQPGLRLRATRITDWGLNERSSQDNDSIRDFGRDELIYRHEMDSLADAQALADYQVSLRKDPRGNVRSIEFSPRSSSTLMNLALSKTIGDRITVIETSTGLSKDVFIIGERHRVTGKNRDQVVTWTTEPADPQAYWLLGTVGFGELGTNTFVGPF